MFAIFNSSVSAKLSSNSPFRLVTFPDPNFPIQFHPSLFASLLSLQRNPPLTHCGIFLIAGIFVSNCGIVPFPIWMLPVLVHIPDLLESLYFYSLLASTYLPFQKFPSPPLFYFPNFYLYKNRLLIPFSLAKVAKIITIFMIIFSPTIFASEIPNHM